jgi:Family of unknown function (DUF6452)
MEDGSLFRLKLKFMKKIFLLLFIGFAFSGCEKDDICDPNTPTTPRLILEFYDDANPTVLKNVVNLKITSVNELNVEVGDTLLFNGVSKVQLPLKTAEDLTKYTFTLNSLDAANDNIDFFEVNYTREDVYVSRACGYKTIFNLIDTNPILYTEPSTPDGLWIKGINIETNAIENENETHVKIYF